MQIRTAATKAVSCLWLAMAACVACVPAATTFAQGVPAAESSPDGLWITLDEVDPADQAAEPWIRPQRFVPAILNEAKLLEVLKNAPRERADEVLQERPLNPLFISLPNPEGVFEVFEVIESPIMEDGLALQFPEIKTYRGQGVTDPHATIRFDHTPQGFHAQVLSPEGSWYIDPYSKNNTVLYASYYKRDYGPRPAFICETTGNNVPDPDVAGSGGYATRNASPLRTYRLAVAATGEYTAYHGGTVALGQAAIVTAMNRVNGVYETQLAIRMTLVANNSNLVYTNSATDPYTNNNGGTMLGQNQTNITNVIGSANYDIGHVFSTGGGGVAQLACVCVNNSKARGVTGSPAPINDPFTIDYVAHEMGHQFAANHTFNSPNGSCTGGNRNSSTAYEPGSGSTIMAYAGICSPDNIQNNSDAYFNASSLAEITNFRNSGSGSTCGTTAATGNTAPTVNAGIDRTIPTRTPFTLTAVGADANGDTLTYSWESRALGAALALSAGDNGSSPIIRSFNAVASPSRTIPRLSNLLNNTTAAGEILPTVARSMTFRVIARDNRAGAGGYGTDDMIVTFVNTGAPFAVTAPNTNVSLTGGEATTVTWDVAGTTGSGINCANVNILLSTDGGNTFPIVLAANTPNDGSQSVTLPNTATTTARIRVEAANNIFFDISNTNFTIVGGIAPTNPPNPTNTTATPNPICPGQTVTLSASTTAGNTIDWFTGGCGTTLVGTGTSIEVTPAVNTTYRARARNLSSGLTSGCSLVIVSLNGNVTLNTAPVAQTVDAGQTATFTVSASSISGLTYRWIRNGVDLADGGAISGSGTNTLTINPAQTFNEGNYSVRITGACDIVTTTPVALTVNAASGCGTADFDGDGDAGTDSDIEAFFACLAGSCCPTCYSGGSDFDGDGDAGTDSDIEAFFRVLAGQPC